MTADEIRAELRRSACDDGMPFLQVGGDAWREARSWCLGDQRMGILTSHHLRLFFLLIAEALE